MKILSTALLAGTLVIAAITLLNQTPGFALQSEGEQEVARVQEPLIQSRNPQGIARQFSGNSPEVRESKRQLREVIKQLQKAAREDRLDEIEEDLTDGLKNYYDTQIEIHEANLRRLEEKVDAMRKKIESRREATEEIIDLRTKLLIRQAELGELNVLTELGPFIDVDPRLNPFGDRGIVLDRLPGPHSDLDPFAQSSELVIPAMPSPDSPSSPFATSPGLGIQSPDAPSLPGMLEDSDEAESKFATIVFASKNELRDGKLSIRSLTNKRASTDISFDFAEDDIETKLRPGEYSYRYEQDGEVWGEGELFVKNTGMQVIEIESGERDSSLAEHRKENVTFNTGSKTLDGVLWVRGMNSDYKKREFKGRFDGQMNFSYLPGEYIYIAISEKGPMSAKTFTVKPGEDLTLTFFEDDEESANEETCDEPDDR